MFDTGPNHGGGPSVPFQHTADKCTVIPQKNSGYNTRLNSSQAIVCEAVPSFIKNRRHIVK